MNRRLLIPLGAGVVVILLWFVALWSPQGSALSDARKRKNDAQQQGATLRDQLTRLQQARADQPLKQSQLETLRVAIPDDPNLAQFILDANDAANKAGIQFLSISPTPPSAQGQGTTAAPGATAGAAPVPIRMAITISGGYFQVLDFINRLNRLPRIVVIDALTFSGGGDISNMSVSISARMFTTSPTPVSGTSTGGGPTSTTAPGGSTTTSSGATTTTRTGGG